MGLKAVIHQASLTPGAEVVRISAREALSTCSDVEVWFWDLSPDLDLEPLLWQEAVVEVTDDTPVAGGGEVAPWFSHGVIEEAEYVQPFRHDSHLYRLRLRPRVHGLAYRVRSRIYQDKTSDEIIRAIFTDAGIPDDAVQWALDSTYRTREYTTQWKESELAFVMRLFEEEGVFFWIEHTPENHILRIADDNGKFQRLEGEAAIPVSQWLTNADRREYIHSVTFGTRFTHDAFTSRDWNWETPATPPEGAKLTSENAAFERYEYPGGFLDGNEGSQRVARRLAAELVPRYTLRGTSTCRRLTPGRRFELVDCYPEPLQGEYVLTSIRHEFRHPDMLEEEQRQRQEAQQDGRSQRNSGEESSEQTWVTTFEAITSDVEYRPPRITPRPRIHGKESAVITGPAGEEIHVDNFGRVKVHFYWDRENPVDDTASCWIRTQQLNTSTSMVLPRLGWEVDVGFLHGDPDRPVVMQKLYNDETMPPYPLPASLAQSSLQSSSSPGGGGTNEIRMNDSNGSMEFFIHAQKDFSLMAGNDMIEDITVDSTVQVGTDCSASVTGNEDESVGGTHSVSVTGAHTSQTTGAQSITVGALDDWGVTGLHTVKVAGARDETVGGLMNVLACKVAEAFNADLNRTVGGALMLTAGIAIAETVGGTKTELVGGAKVEIISKAKGENVGAGKILNAGLVQHKTGKDIQCNADGAIAINVGGPIAIKCGGDFAITGSKVVMNVGTAKLDAGGKITATPGAIKLKAGKIEGAGSNVQMKGQMKIK